MKFIEIIKQVEDNPHSAFFYTPSFYRKALSYLLIKPSEVISIYKREDLKSNFNLIHKLIDKGYYGYSLIKYEAGFLFEEKLAKFKSGDSEELIQFFFFDKQEVRQIKSSKIFIGDFSSEKYSIKNFKLNRSESKFLNDIEKIKRYIREGDTYQVNYTVKGKFIFSGSYSSFFQKLIFNQSARYSALINGDNEFIISLSPELFFSKKGKNIVSLPMKGTIRRGHNHNLDGIAATELKSVEKNLAENVMIVDLIRNDFGRVCRYGSIKVPELFRIEKYESLFQMVSEVRGKLRKKTQLQDILENIFPCGSVTGTPKIRTMEIINEIEGEQRGIYTGSIGLITPIEIKFNVAIRTISVNKKSGAGIMGLGSGIVWDSNPQCEYEEVLLKSKFLAEPLEYFELFETIKYENGEIKLLEQHLARLKSAADFFLFKFSEKKIRKQLAISLKQTDLHILMKVKLTLSKWGDIKVEISDLQVHNGEVSVIVSRNKINSLDKFSHFKTTNRKLYDNEYASFSKKGFSEVIYLNEKDNIAEGSRTNIFLRKGDSWFTPPLDSGALPGVYRRHFIEAHPKTFEKNITVSELQTADEILLTNALREEIKVDKLFINEDEYVIFKKDF